MTKKISRRNFMKSSATLLGLLSYPRFSSSEELSNLQGKWEKRENIPESRLRTCSAVAGFEGKIYVFGGCSGIKPYGAYEYSNRSYYLDAYDPKTNSWTKLNPKPRISPNGPDTIAVTLDNLIYIVGGLNSGNEPQCMESYDPKKDKREGKATLPNHGRMFGLEAININNQLYLINGAFNSWEDRGRLYSFNAKINKWERRADLSSDRVGLRAIAAEGKLLVIGGNSTYYDSNTLIEMYDPKTDSWTRLPDMPNKRSSFGVGVINNKLYLFGGESTIKVPIGKKDLHIRKDINLPGVDILDLKTARWSRGADMITPRSSMGTCVLNNQIYSVGGISYAKDPFGRNEPTIVPTLEVFTP